MSRVALIPRRSLLPSIRPPFTRIFPAVFGIALVARIVAIHFFAPATDVFYYDTQAAGALLAGENPYAHFFGGIPASLVTPGAERVFAYFPLTALYLVPFYVLGDVRYGLLFADAVIGASLYFLRGKRSGLASILYLLVPPTIIFSTLYVNDSLISMVFLALFFTLEQRQSRLAAGTALGASLAATQFVLLLFPFFAYYYLNNRRYAELLTSLAVAAAVVLPFAIPAPSNFAYETITFQFARPTFDLVTKTGPLLFNLNPSLNGLLQTLVGFTLPWYARMGAILILLPAFLVKARTLKDVSLYGALFLLLSLFVVPNDFFWGYTELPFLLLLVSLAVRGKTTLPKA